MRGAQKLLKVVCKKAEELNAATLVLSTKKQNEVRANAARTLQWCISLR
jgi:hypothetical protein